MTSNSVTSNTPGRQAGLGATAQSIFSDPARYPLALFDRAGAAAGARMVAAYHAQDTWLGAVRGALEELLTFFDEHPRLARFLVVESLSGDAALRARRTEALARLAGALDAERPTAGESAVPAPFGGEAVVGAVASILHGRLQEPASALRELSGPLMGLIALAYLDAANARTQMSPVQAHISTLASA